MGTVGVISHKNSFLPILALEGEFMEILVTGFDPFGGSSINPAWEAVKRLDGKVLDGQHTVHALMIPTVRYESLAAIKRGIEQFDPLLVIAVGQAGGRMAITPERAAINCDDFRIPDNKGFQPIDEMIVPDGPAAYFSTLPIKRIVMRLTAAGIPAQVSNSAGTFVCNHVFYGLMDFMQKEGKGRRGGFIHVPYLPEQAACLKNEPSMCLELIVEGLTLAIKASVETGADEGVTGGVEC